MLSYLPTQGGRQVRDSVIGSHGGWMPDHPHEISLLALSPNFNIQLDQVPPTMVMRPQSFIANNITVFFIFSFPQRRSGQLATQSNTLWLAFIKAPYSSSSLSDSWSQLEPIGECN
ncbi:hypothetical protein V2G26_015387 [Clonostachys chloroleuca]